MDKLDAVPVFLGLEAALFREPVLWESLLECVLCYRVRFQVVLRLLFFLWLILYAIALQDLFIRFLAVYAMEFRIKCNEVSATVFCMAFPLAGPQINGEGVVSVIMKRA